MTEPHRSPTPYLSIVLTGRNDGHGGDFRDRFFRTLEFNLRELAARAIAFEVLLVEWCPDSGRPLLVDLLPDVPGASEAPIDGIVVDRQYQDALSLNPDLTYLEFVAKNVGIRRARGQFVLSTNCDVFLGRHILDLLQRRALEPGRVYRAPRNDLKLAADSTNLTWDVLEDVRNLEGKPRRLRLPLLAGGTGDFVLLDRETFHRLRGFNEVYRLASVGVDSNFLVKAVSAGVPIVDIGGPVYHANHPNSYRLRPRVSGGAHLRSWGTVRWPSRGVVYVNSDAWGLGLAPETTIGRGRRRLDFAWTAVPPLVDLRRVVLPVARTGGPAAGRDVPQSQEI